jgi:predicted DNA-binding transcriptional regulator YafY
MPPRRAPAKLRPPPPAYAPARRLHELKLLLQGSGGASVYDVAERLEVSVRTALRYLEALKRAGEPVYDETLGRRKIWRLMPSARQGALTLTTSQMLSLFLSRRVVDFLAGTGFKEDLDDVFRKLEVTLRRRDLAAARNLERKIYDINEAPHIYSDRLEDVNDIVTALLREERLLGRHESVRDGRESFRLDPYTLIVYRKGLYLAGFSHLHGEVRTLTLDGFRELTWLKEERFDYPADYQPSRLFEGAFGLIVGPPAKVRIQFSDKVARFVRRRLWHSTQRIRKVPGGIELAMEVRGTTELQSWVLGFGRHATVLAPAELRQAVQAELRDALAGYSAEGEPEGLP